MAFFNHQQTAKEYEIFKKSFSYERQTPKRANRKKKKKSNLEETEPLQEGRNLKKEITCIFRDIRCDIIAGTQKRIYKTWEIKEISQNVSNERMQSNIEKKKEIYRIGP